MYHGFINELILQHVNIYEKTRESFKKKVSLKIYFNSDKFPNPKI